VFLRGCEDDRLAALKTNLVIHCLNVGEQDRLADDLNRVHLLLKSGLPLSPVEQLNPGAEAEIISGPLAGFRGTIVRHGSNSRIVVEVEFLQRGVSVEVDEAIIQPIWRG
jgi:transcriptional antiterminator RfaH